MTLPYKYGSIVSGSSTHNYEVQIPGSLHTIENICQNGTLWHVGRARYINTVMKAHSQEVVINRLIQESHGRVTREMVFKAIEYISLFAHEAILGQVVNGHDFTWQGILDQFGDTASDSEPVWRRMTLALLGVMVFVAILMVATGHKPF